jgi:hypothetical protein
VTKIIPLAGGHFALVDDEDYERVSALKWHLSPTGYGAARTPRPERKLVQLHRFILNPPDDMQVDHINGNGLDCRRENMRLATHQQNQQNRPGEKRRLSKYKGVWLDDRYRKPWRAQIKADRTRYDLGRFASEDDAARAYNDAAKKLHGEFAWLNPIE